MCGEKEINNREEKMEEKNFGCDYAITGVSAFIFNDYGQLFLVRSPKWGNLWVVPGDKVEKGETLEQALKREVKEETNLAINIADHLKTIELNKTKERPNLHMVVNEYLAKTDDSDVKLNDEHSEFDWRAPEEWLKDEDLYPNVGELIEYYLKEYLPKQDCANLYKRALADYQNLLKQTAREKVECAAFANELLLKEILPVYDHLKMAILHHNGQTTDEWLTGVNYVVKQFQGALKKVGVEEIIADGKKFDHNIMEAVGSEETDDEKLDCTVVKQVKAGYRLNGKVIEAAKVIVYKMK